MSRAVLVLGLAGLFPASLLAVAPPAQEQWIVVTAPAFRKTIEPLIIHRRAQGLRVHVLISTDVLTAKEIAAGDARRLRDRVHALCRAHPGASSVLLVGAVTPGRTAQPEQFVVPPLRGEVSRMKGQPSDAAYGCPDGKRLPTVAVGRFPARIEEEAQVMVKRTLTLERATAPGLWKRRLTVLAGIPAYNPVVDRLIENLAFARFDRIHPTWSGRAIYTSSTSRFRLPDRELRSQSLAYLREGQVFTLYLGHSDAEGLYAGPMADFLNRADWLRAVMPHGGGVFITFGCNGCQLTGRDGEGYGVWAMRNPAGPAAVIGSHGICFAAMVQLAADSLFARAFQGALPGRVGDCWLAVMHGLAQGKTDFLTYNLLDAVDGDRRIPQATQREEHLEMFVLLGDPALRLPYIGKEIRLDVPSSISAGKPLLVRGRLPENLDGARVQVLLERTPGSAPVDLDRVPDKPGAEQDRIVLANHRRANRFLLGEASVKARGRAFEVRVAVPGKLPWPRLVLRVHAATEREEGLAALTLPTASP